MNNFEPSPYSRDPQTRTLFIVAGVGAILASLYWGGMTLLLLLGAVAGSLSPAQVILPFVLIVLYAYRGFQLFQGNVSAARRIVWLHAVGAAVALLQVLTGGLLVAILHGIKLSINIFGGVSAFLAARSTARAPAAF
jgi:hypothetical protein